MSFRQVVSSAETAEDPPLRCSVKVKRRSEPDHDVDYVHMSTKPVATGDPQTTPPQK